MKFENITVGERLSSTMYLEVLQKGTEEIKVKDNFGREFIVRGTKLIEATMNSSRQFDSTESVSKTKAAEILLESNATVFEVIFDKANGEERTLVGYLLNTENLMGRSNVIDLAITSGNPLRQIDHRTIKSIISKDTRNVVKK